MITIEEGKTTSIISLGLFLVIMGFIIYSVMSNPYGRITALATPLFILAFTFMIIYGDYIPMIPRGRQVNFESGIAGTLRGSLKHHAGGRATGLISIEKALVPDSVAMTRRAGGIHYFLDWMTMGNITVKVTGDKEQWIDIPTSDSDNPHGSMRFIGNIKGEYVENSAEALLQKRLKEAATMNRYAVSALEAIRAQVSNLASQKMMEMDASSQLLQHIGDRVKNIKLITKKGGGDDAIASEMSSN